MKKTNVEKAMVMMMVCSACVMAEEATFTEETAAGYLKLTPPVKVLRYSVYLDGGSIGTSLADAAGKEFHIFEDYSMGSGGNEFMIGKTNYPESLRAIYNRPVTAGRIFIGEGDPTKNQKITPVEEGKRIKAAVEFLAIAWLDREFTTEEQKQLVDVVMKRRNRESGKQEIEERMVPPMKHGDTSEESRAAFDAYMKDRYRFDAALYIVNKLKGMVPPRQKAEPAKPEP